MSHSARLLLSAAATAATLAVLAPAAGAATVSATNVCYSMDGNVPGYGTLPLQLTPASVAQNGRQLDVGAVTPTVVIPSWLPDKINSVKVGGLTVGQLLLGQSVSVPVTSWMAVTPAGSTDGPKVVTTTGTVKVNVSNFSVKSVDLTLKASAATSWHAPDAGGTLSVSQAGPGSLASVPELASAAPKGSLFIKGSVAGMNLQVDCQPGTNSSPEDPSSLTSGMLPGTPAIIASADFSPGPVATPTPAPAATPTPAPAATPKPTATGTTSTPLAAGALAIASPSLKFGSAAVLVNISCPAGASPCTGTATMTSAKKLKVGKTPAKIRALASGAYSVPAGTTAPVKLKLTADGKKLRTKALIATVTLKPTSGALVTKTLKANG